MASVIYVSFNSKILFRVLQFLQVFISRYHSAPAIKVRTNFHSQWLYELYTSVLCFTCPLKLKDYILSYIKVV